MQSVARNLNETFAASPGSVGEARGLLARFAEAAGATPAQVEGVRLAASEAMTNCVVHAYNGGTGTIEVNAGVVADELWILISDEGSGLAPRADRPGLGVGLGLISQVADDVVVLSRARGGTEVRVRFNLADGGSPGPGTAPRPEFGGAGAMPSMWIA